MLDQGAEFDLIVANSEEGIAEGVSPTSHGTHEYTRIIRTQPLLEALAQGEFDAAIGGGRHGVGRMVDGDRGDSMEAKKRLGEDHGALVIE